MNRGMSEQEIIVPEGASLGTQNKGLCADSRTGSLQSHIRRVLVLAMLYASASCLAADALVTRESGNTDLWWPLGTGEWIIQHHRLPATDPFSRYDASKTWVAYNWLFEVALDWCYRLLGFPGTAVFMVAIAYASGWVLFPAIRKRMGGFAGSIALTALGLLLMLALSRVRPWLFSVLRN